MSRSRALVSCYTILACKGHECSVRARPPAHTTTLFPCVDLHPYRHIWPRLAHPRARHAPCCVHPAPSAYASLRIHLAAHVHGDSQHRHVSAHALAPCSYAHAHICLCMHCTCTSACTAPVHVYALRACCTSAVCMLLRVPGLAAVPVRALCPWACMHRAPACSHRTGCMRAPARSSLGCRPRA